MPFDPTPQTPVHNADEIAIVDGMQRMLASPRDWITGCLRHLHPDLHVSHCLIGALRTAQSDNPDKMVAKYTPAGHRVAKVLRRHCGGSVIKFNDDGCHQDVVEVLSKVRAEFEFVPPLLALVD
jgi:hypothetical protein